jgi:hypothetical protein
LEDFGAFGVCISISSLISPDGRWAELLEVYVIGMNSRGGELKLRAPEKYALAKELQSRNDHEGHHVNVRTAFALAPVVNSTESRT